MYFLLDFTYAGGCCCCGCSRVECFIPIRSRIPPGLLSVNDAVVNVMLLLTAAMGGYIGFYWAL